jgi:tetratricopeptide (TPR) repeat protein
VTDTDLVQAGMAAAKAGQRQQAAALLAQAVRLNPASESAWFWLGLVCQTPEQRTYCLNRVLALNPQHTQARQLLAPPASASAQTPAVVPALTTTEELPRAAPAAQRPPPEAPAPPPLQAPTEPSPAPPLAEAKPWTTTERMLVALLGFVLAVAVCGGGLAFLVMSHQLDRAAAQVAAGLWSPTPSFTPTLSLTPSITPSPTDTPVPSDTPTRTFTPSPRPTRTRSPTPTPNPTAQAEQVAALMDQAQASMEGKNYAEAVTVLDKAVAQAPGSAEAYFQRARAYHGLLSNNRFHDEWIDYVHRALADVNQAIALDPTVGDYYYFRYMFEEDLAIDAPYRADYVALETIALENVRIANQLGNTQPDSERKPALILPNLGRCDEGLAEAQHLIDARGPTAPASPGLNTALAESYICKGQFDAALQHINTALEVDPTYDRIWDKSLILYSLGRLDEALALLNDDINHYPYY